MSCRTILSDVAFAHYREQYMLENDAAEREQHNRTHDECAPERLGEKLLAVMSIDEAEAAVERIVEEWVPDGAGRSGNEARGS
jgi:hypothetical protein